MKKLIPFLLASLPLAGCTTLAEDGRSFLPETSSLAVIPAKTQTQHLLADIPPPSRPVAIAVYGFSDQRSEEHTSELQSLMRISYAVFCLKKNKNNTEHIYNQLNITDT